MIPYLSEDWLQALNEAAAQSAELAEATQGIALSLQQVITGAPAGDVAFHVSIDHGTVRFAPGSVDAPDITFTQDYDTAVSIGQANLSAQAAFMVGKIRVEGQLDRFTDDYAAIERLNDVFVAVRARTEF